jgi:hypothetical protein
MMNKQYAEGLIGEKIVANFLIASGFKIRFLIDPYETAGDLLILWSDGKDQTVEVKTQVPYISKRAFSFNANQVEKLQRVDCLWLVCSTSQRYPNHPFVGKTFLYEKTRGIALNFTDPDPRTGRIMLPLEQEALVPGFMLKQDEIDTLKKWSS